MKLEVFDLETMPAVKLKTPSVALVAVKILKNGRIFLTKGCIEKLNIVPGTKIKILRNQDAPNEWFLVKSVEDNAYSLTLSKVGIYFSNKNLAEHLIKNMSENKNVLPPQLTMRIGIEPIEGNERYRECYPIIVPSQKEFIKK
jgi:hypothetical protein